MVSAKVTQQSDDKLSPQCRPLGTCPMLFLSYQHFLLTGDGQYGQAISSGSQSPSGQVTNNWPVQGVRTVPLDTDESIT